MSEELSHQLIFNLITEKDFAKRHIILKEIDLMLKFADMAGYQRHKKQLELLKE